MNEAQAVRESTQLEKKLETLIQQNNAIQDCWKDLYSLQEGFNTVGKKLNYAPHPDNNEKTTLSSGPTGHPEEPNTDSGIIGELQNIISVRQSLVFEFNNSIYPKLQRELYHLTNQI